MADEGPSVDRLLRNLFPDTGADEEGLIVVLRHRLAGTPPANAAKVLCKAALWLTAWARRVVALICQAEPEYASVCLAVFQELFDRRHAAPGLPRRYLLNGIEFLILLTAAQVAEPSCPVALGQALLADIAAGPAEDEAPWSCLVTLILRCRAHLLPAAADGVEGTIRNGLGVEQAARLAVLLTGAHADLSAAVTAGGALAAAAWVAAVTPHLPTACRPLSRRESDSAPLSTTLPPPVTEASSSTDPRPRAPTPTLEAPGSELAVGLQALEDLGRENAALRRILQDKAENEVLRHQERADLVAQLAQATRALEREREGSQALLREVAALRAQNERLLQELQSPGFTHLM